MDNESSYPDQDPTPLTSEQPSPISDHVDDELDIQTIVPPHSMVAEQAVIGGLLKASDRWNDVAQFISAKDFYRKEHQLIVKCMEYLIEHDQPLDVITLMERLNAVESLAAIGGMHYLAELAQNTPSVVNIRAYASVVKEKALARELLTLATSLEQRVRRPEGATTQVIIEDIESRLLKLSSHQPNESSPQAITPLLKSTIDHIDTLLKNKGTLAGLSSSFNDLDKRTYGLHRSDLIIVAARPAMGKTSFAMNLVESALFNAPPDQKNQPVLVFSMEMSAEQLMLRLISSVGKINQNNMRSGQMDDEDLIKLKAAIAKLKDTPLMIDDTPALSTIELRARVGRVYREQGPISLIMIDYLQLMTTQSRRMENRTNEISEISRSLKALAKEFNCPVVALSQLNRNLEQRPNKRPVMSDLRESGAIEQDADLILFIYRDEVYNEDSADKGKAEIILGKNRHGEISVVPLAFIGRYTRFENLAPEHYHEMGPNA